MGFQSYDTVAIRILKLNEAALDIKGARSPLRSACFPVYASHALFAALTRSSAAHATLGTGGWPTLTR